MSLIYNSIKQAVKKSILFIFILNLASSIAFSQNAPITQAGSAITTGNTVTIPITISSSPAANIASCNLRILYDASVASAVQVTKGPGVPGNYNYNVSTAGVITIGWYHSNNFSVSASTVFFTITFNKVTSGTANLTFFDNGNTCKYSDINSVVLNDVPASTYYLPGSVTFQGDAPKTAFPAEIIACPGESIAVPVTVTDFNTIGAVSLTMTYVPSVLSYVSATSNPAFDLEINLTSPGVIVIGGIAASTGVSLPNGSTLLTLYFTYNGGTTGLSWYDNGTSCEYANDIGYALPDIPQSEYYGDGLVIPCNYQVNLKLFLEGLYNPALSEMNKAKDFVGGNIVDKYAGKVADKIDVELHSEGNYGNIVYTASNIDLNQNGVAIVNIPPEYSGNYYLTIRHRNHIASVSALAVTIGPATTAYDFTTSADQAYGSNQKQLASGVFGFFAGDVNQDGLININDAGPLNTGIRNSSTGYLAIDVNGDGLININDSGPVNTNIRSVVQSITP